MRRPVAVLSGAVVLALACGIAAVAQETPTEPLTISWLATGDSFSSGQGVEGNFGDCAQAVALAYAPVARSRVEASGLFRVDPFIFSACSGYLASDFYGIHEGGMGQSLWDWSSAMAGEDRRYDVITLTFGGNDVGFADVLVDCLMIPDGWEDLLTEPNVLLFDDCDVTEEELLARIDGLVGSDTVALGVAPARPTGEVSQGSGTPRGEGTLADLYRDIAERHLTLGGHMYVLGYPHLFAASTQFSSLEFVWCHGVTRGDAEMLNRVADYLNERIFEAVKAADGGLDRIHFIPVDFSGHELCGADREWINGITWPLAGSFHPKDLGHQTEGEFLARYVVGAGEGLDPARLIAAREAVPVVNAWVGADEVLYVVMEDGAEYSEPLDLVDGRGWVEGGRDLDGDGVVEVFVVMPLVGAAYQSHLVYTVKDGGLHSVAELAESGNSYNRDSGLECRRLPEGGDEIRAWGAEGWSEPFWSFSEITRRLVGTSLAIESEREFNLPNSGDPAADMRTPEQVEFRRRGCAMEVQFPGVPPNEIVAEAGGIGDARFGMEPDEALAILTGYFGQPSEDSDWYVDDCDGRNWRVVRWQGLSAIFTDREGPYNREGSPAFDGWSVKGNQPRPDNVKFAWGITPETLWGELSAAGAESDSFYSAWTLNRFGLTGHFAEPVGDDPRPDSRTFSFGTGTGGFISC